MLKQLLFCLTEDCLITERMIYMAYQYRSRIRYSEIGEDKKLTLPGLVNYFQDCSTFQSEALGIGLDTLGARQRAWLLASWKIVIDRLPRLGEEVVTETWPYGFKGFQGNRNFRMLDQEGHTLAAAASVWIYLNVESGHPCRIDGDVLEAYELEEELPLGPFSRKIPVPEESTERDSFLVMRSHLDTNHHVNNGQYILMAEEYLPEGFKVKQIRVEYRKAAVLHDTIVPFVCTEPQRCTVSLCGSDEKPFAVVEFSE